MNRDALADFLKRRREALQPGDVGLRDGARRRTSGLRREDVAALADISTDFYARLEQRRGPRPSEQTVQALCQALQLTRDEGDHLFTLAGHNPPRRTGRVDEPSPGLLRILERLEAPAQIVTDVYVTLAQNGWSRALLGEQTRLPEARRSLIVRWFTEPETRGLYHPEDLESYSRYYVATLRAVHGGADHDEATRLVERLLAESPEFQLLWERHEVAWRPFRLKRFLHPVAGSLTLDCQTLTSENVRERLIVFTPPSPEDARALELLRPFSGD